MGRFLEQEKERYVSYKANSPFLIDEARQPGVYKNRSRPFCLPRAYSAFNLFEGIRAEAQDYFTKFEIKWHDAIDRTPSNHLCDSQVCCVNFLYPFATEPAALRALLLSVYPDIQEMLPLDEHDRYVAHEWIGAENYLGERMAQQGKRIRGANFTSADAAVMFRNAAGARHLVLIEWKYTETYSSVDKTVAASGTNRADIYRRLFENPAFPLELPASIVFEDLFFEPFYQLLRQQMLANEMEQARELGAETVSILHIAPALNTGFTFVTSPNLRQVGDSVTAVWKKLVRNPDRFRSESVERLFGNFRVDEHSSMRPWWDYSSDRYPWFNGPVEEYLIA
jgi:hypothetical protein